MYALSDALTLARTGSWNGEPVLDCNQSMSRSSPSKMPYGNDPIWLLKRNSLSRLSSASNASGCIVWIALPCNQRSVRFGSLLMVFALISLIWLD